MILNRLLMSRKSRLEYLDVLDKLKRMGESLFRLLYCIHGKKIGRIAFDSQLDIVTQHLKSMNAAAWTKDDRQVSIREVRSAVAEDYVSSYTRYTRWIQILNRGENRVPAPVGHLLLSRQHWNSYQKSYEELLPLISGPISEVTDNNVRQALRWILTDM
jgi:hypothetical protein